MGRIVLDILSLQRTILAMIPTPVALFLLFNVGIGLLGQLLFQLAYSPA